MAKDNRPEVSQNEIRIIDSLRARNMILRKALSSAADETSGKTEAALRTALDRELELSR